MFPEFRTASPAFVQQYLDAAAPQVSKAVFLESFDIAHGYKTADLMARSPSGIMARMVAKDGSTAYGKAFSDLTRTKISGVTVA